MMTERNKLTIDLMCAWCGPVWAVLIVIFWGFISTNAPFPPDPSSTPLEMAGRWLANQTGIRVGFIVSAILLGLLMPWTCLISKQMAKIEGESRTLTWLQLTGGALTMLVVSISCFFWCVAAMRPERSPELILMLVDMGWLTNDLLYVCTQMQMWAIAIVGLLDKSKTPLFPRWMNWYTIWAAISFFPASFTAVFTTGPFAYNGVLSFYIPYAAWFIWVPLLSIFMIKEVKGRIAAYNASQSAVA